MFVVVYIFHMCSFLQSNIKWRYLIVPSPECFLISVHIYLPYAILRPLTSNLFSFSAVIFLHHGYYTMIFFLSGNLLFSDVYFIWYQYIYCAFTKTYISAHCGNPRTWETKAAGQDCWLSQAIWQKHCYFHPLLSV